MTVLEEIGRCPLTGQLVLLVNGYPANWIRSSFFFIRRQDYFYLPARGYIWATYPTLSHSFNNRSDAIRAFGKYVRSFQDKRSPNWLQEGF